MKRSRRQFLTATAGVVAVPLAWKLGSSEKPKTDVVANGMPALLQEKLRKQKRITLIEVFVQDGKVKDKMLDGATRKVMEAIDQDPAVQAKEAAALRERRNPAHAAEVEGPHAGIHVLRGRGDEVIFFSTQDISFEVDFEYNPEFLPIAGAPSNIFSAPLPLRSEKGEAVSTGPTVSDALAFKQSYYKYTIRVAGAEPLDPHVEGHDFCAPDDPDPSCH